MKGLVNWEAIQHIRMAGPPKADEAQQKRMWGSAANMYDGMARLEKKYTKNQIEQMKLGPDDTVLDIGCGPGRLTVPIARKVKSVTAVDISTEMIEKCMKNAESEGVHNIKPLQLNWFEDDAEKKAGKHDIVIASRSPGLSDLIKLNNIARKYVYLLCWANAPSLREIQLSFLEGITDIKTPEGANDRMFGYNITFNMIYDLGLDPNVVIVEDGFERDYESKEQAYEDLRFVGDIQEKYEEQYRRNVDKYLTAKQDGGFKLLRKTKTFVMWWEPKQLEIL